MIKVGFEVGFEERERCHPDLGFLENGKCLVWLRLEERTELYWRSGRRLGGLRVLRTLPYTTDVGPVQNWKVKGLLFKGTESALKKHTWIVYSRVWFIESCVKAQSR